MLTMLGEKSINLLGKSTAGLGIKSLFYALNRQINPLFLSAGNADGNFRLDKKAGIRQ